MAHRIEKTEDLIEVHLWGDAHLTEVLTVLRKLHALTPRKEISDLWLIAEEYVVPWATFSTIVKAVTHLLGRDMVMAKSAIVVANEFQVAQASMYQEAAHHLPFKVGVFRNRDAAVQWLKT